MAKINMISREDQDRMGIDSHKKADTVRKNGYFEEEIIPIWSSPKFDCVAEDKGMRVLLTSTI